MGGRFLKNNHLKTKLSCGIISLQTHANKQNKHECLYKNVPNTILQSQSTWEGACKSVYYIVKSPHSLDYFLNIWAISSEEYYFGVSNSTL